MPNYVFPFLNLNVLFFPLPECLNVHTEGTLQRKSTCIYIQRIQVVMILSPQCDLTGFTSMCM